MELGSHDCYSEGKIKLGRPTKERTKWVLGSWLLSLLARCITLLGMLGNVYFWLFWITACNSFSCGLTTLRNNWREYLFCIPSSPDCYPFNTSWEKPWVLCLASPLSCAVFGAQHIFYSVSTFQSPLSHTSNDYLAMYGVATFCYMMHTGYDPSSFGRPHSTFLIFVFVLLHAQWINFLRTNFFF